jgi:hypothetical protein
MSRQYRHPGSVYEVRTLVGDSAKRIGCNGARRVAQRPQHGRVAHAGRCDSGEQGFELGGQFRVGPGDDIVNPPIPHYL